MARCHPHEYATVFGIWTTKACLAWRVLSSELWTYRGDDGRLQLLWVGRRLRRRRHSAGRHGRHRRACAERAARRGATADQYHLAWAKTHRFQAGARRRRHLPSISHTNPMLHRVVIDPVVVTNRFVFLFDSVTRKLPSIMDWGHTDHVDLDFHFHVSYVHDPHSSEVSGCVQKIEWKQTDSRTRLIALAFSLRRLVQHERDCVQISSIHTYTVQSRLKSN